MSDAYAWLNAWLDRHEADLVALRRDLHAHPELGWEERATTERVARELSAAGLAPRVLDSGTGLVCDVGSGGPVVALRADIDALPVADVKDVPYRSKVAGVCHACGHDVHTTVLTGAGLALAEAGLDLGGTVRLIFQPAEELTPGGALEVIRAGLLERVGFIAALHCDPRLDVGLVGMRVGPITAAADWLDVTVTGPGGHTARPHLTGDLVWALAKVATETPAWLGRRVDPRAALSLVWGSIHAGDTHNVIPAVGRLSGTVRMLDVTVWEGAVELVRRAIAAATADTGVEVAVDYVQGTPPVVNDADVVAAMERAVQRVVGQDAVVPTETSLGAEDFGWYLADVPGAMARLGVRRHGGETRDLHRGDFDVDEAAIGVGVRTLVATALEGLSRAAGGRAI
jgi:amidohydrolase